MQHLLPTENELSEQYHVSRVTVRKAFAALDSQGYLEKKSGKGTFIAEKKMQRSLYVRLRKEWDDIATGNTRLFSEAMADIRSHRSR